MINDKYFPYLIIIAGFILIIFGIIWLFGSKIGLGNLPGDIRIEKDNFKFYFPITTSIIISIILTLIFLIINKLR